MIGRARDTTRYQQLRASGRVLGGMAPWIRLGLLGVGGSLFLDQVRPLLSDAQLTWGERRVLGIVAFSTLGGAWLASWLAGRLLKAAAELIELLIEGVDATWRTADLIELRMVPTLGRIANALERTGPGGTPAVGEPMSNRASTTTIADEIRDAIAGGRWGEAERLVGDHERRSGRTSEARRLADEIVEARQAVVAGLRSRLETARLGDDPTAAIDIRDALTEHLRGGPLHDLDEDLVRWLVRLIRARVRSGKVDATFLMLAERVAETFGDTKEGTRLRVSLPTLYRNAGLCPGCGRPHRGLDPTCPACAATRPADDEARATTRAVPNPKAHP